MGTHTNTMFTNHFTHSGACGTVYNNAFSANIAWQNELTQERLRHEREMIQQRGREREREQERRIAASHAAALRNAVEVKREVETQRKRREEGLHLKLRCAWDASTTCIVVRHDA